MILRTLARALGLAGVFVGLFGVGWARWPVAVTGAGALVAAAALGLAAEALRREPPWVYGTGRVESVTDPPVDRPYARCQMQLAVVTPGLSQSIPVVVRDTSVPTAHWPEVGDVLPVQVTLARRGARARVLWDGVPRTRQDSSSS